MYIRFNNSGLPDMVSGGFIENGYEIPEQFANINPWSLRLSNGQIIENPNYINPDLWKYGSERPIKVIVPKELTKKGGALKEFLFDIVTDHVPYNETQDGLKNEVWLKFLAAEDRTVLEQFTGQGVEIFELTI